MPRRRPSRLPIPLRVVALLLFALSLSLQPVLASFGEMHALSHDEAAPHVVADEHSGRTGEGVDPDEQANPEPLGALHFLMHFAHCCGHAPMALPQVARVAPVSTHQSCPVMAESQRLAETPSLAPFRPPITT